MIEPCGGGDVWSGAREDQPVEGTGPFSDSSRLAQEDAMRPSTPIVRNERMIEPVERIDPFLPNGPLDQLLSSLSAERLTFPASSRTAWSTNSNERGIL